jgi:predicted DNA-binding transcriptional regulator AlpA
MRCTSSTWTGDQAGFRVRQNGKACGMAVSPGNTPDVAHLAELELGEAAHALPAAADRWVSEKEAAQIIGFSRRTLQSWRAERTGPPYSTPPGSSAVRYRVRDLHDWMNQGRVDGEVQDHAV